MNKDKLNLDPRAGIFLLLVLNFTIFNVSKTFSLFLLLLWSCVYAVYNGLYKISIKFVVAYLLFYGIEFFVLPKLPSLIAMSFAILKCFLVILLANKEPNTAHIRVNTKTPISTTGEVNVSKVFI